MTTTCARRPLAERFWEKVDKNGPIPPHCPELGQCWVWVGYVGDHGYGKLATVRRGENRSAHRISFLLEHGRWPTPFCLHACDNRLCVRPDHLFEGNHSDNMRDMALKGRHWTELSPERVPKGIERPNSKLTEENVAEIRGTRETLVNLAKKFGVKFQTVSDVRRRRSWRHLP